MKNWKRKYDMLLFLHTNTAFVFAYLSLPRGASKFNVSLISSACSSTVACGPKKACGCMVQGRRLYDALQQPTHPKQCHLLIKGVASCNNFSGQTYRQKREMRPPEQHVKHVGPIAAYSRPHPQGGPAPWIVNCAKKLRLQLAIQPHWQACV